MADKLVTIGINSISLQEINPTTGADVGTPILLGDTLEDSFSMTTDEGTEVTINVEESSAPIYSDPGNQTVSVTWQSPNADMESLASITGGTWTAATGYSAPRKRTVKNFEVTVTTEQGYNLVLNNVRLTASVDGSLGKNNALTLTASGTCLVPPTGTKGAWDVVVKTP